MKINKKLVILFLAIIPVLIACSSVAKMKRQEKRRQNDTEKMIDARQKEAEKQYNEAVDQHWKNQDAKTKRRMKKTAYQSVDHQDSKNQSFLKRLFSKNKAKKTKHRDLK
ncbi:hypothetical protein ACFL6I_05055 [candidate division KSB1 bacterium]